MVHSIDLVLALEFRNANTTPGYTLHNNTDTLRQHRTWSPSQTLCQYKIWSPLCQYRICSDPVLPVSETGVRIGLGPRHDPVLIQGLECNQILN